MVQSQRLSWKKAPAFTILPPKPRPRNHRPGRRTRIQQRCAISSAQRGEINLDAARCPSIPLPVPPANARSRFCNQMPLPADWTERYCSPRGGAAITIKCKFESRQNWVVLLAVSNFSRENCTGAVRDWRYNKSSAAVSFLRTSSACSCRRSAEAFDNARHLA
jgi:hypothetical protein